MFTVEELRNLIVSFPEVHTVSLHITRNALHEERTQTAFPSLESLFEISANIHQNVNSVFQHSDVRLNEVANVVEHLRELEEEYSILVSLVELLVIFPLVIVEAFSLEDVINFVSERI